LLKIHQQGADLLADSRAVAKLFGVEHPSLRKLIEEHSSQLEQLGVYRFEIGKPLPGSSGGRPDLKALF
jgi:phage regulator Rha-like protein